MQVKATNIYRITHKSGKTESISAKSLMQALENMEITDEESPVIQTFMVRENIATVMEEMSAEILFSAVTAEGGGGSVATPSSGHLHVGDSVAFSAIAADGYEFVCWKRNDKVISREPSFVYEMTPLLEGEDTAVFTAEFALAPVECRSEVYPAEAGGAGCVAFPPEAVAKIGGDVSFIAVGSDGWTFDHWERDGENIGTSRILETAVSAPATVGQPAVYRAVFTAVAVKEA